MSLRLYATEYTTQLSPELFAALLRRLPEDLGQKVTRFRRWEDAHAALLGKHLLRIALRQAGVSDDLSHLRYTAQDRPWLPEAPDFNISHSGNRVVCVLNTSGRVGIDLEAIKPLDFEDFQTQFTPREWTAIRSDPDPTAGFFRFWTAKESLIKADGRGLNIPLQEIDLSGIAALPQDGVGGNHTLALDGVWWSIRPIPRFVGYASHLTIESSLAPSPLPPVEFHELTINQLCEMA
jgi:4'-phosphopantetheinyl transferase